VRSWVWFNNWNGRNSSSQRTRIWWDQNAVHPRGFPPKYIHDSYRKQPMMQLSLSGWFGFLTRNTTDGVVGKRTALYDVMGALCQVVVGLVYMPSSWSIYIIINSHLFHIYFTFISHLFHIYFLWTRTILNCSTEAGYTRRNTQLRSHPVNYTVSCTFYAKLHQGHQSHHNLPSSSFDVHIVY